MATAIKSIRKDLRNSEMVTATSKILKVLKEELTTISLVVDGKRIVLDAENDSISVKEASLDLSSLVAGNVVQTVQRLYDELKEKMFLSV